jgi:NADPH:quinone reductase-like Zn-dependent oxidoreductase
MKAIVYERYGPPDVLTLKRVHKPSPKDDEILVAVKATTATSGDARMRSMNLPPGFSIIGRLVFGISGPRQKILGAEFSGVVEQVGKNVTDVHVGDAVFGMTGFKLGCYAEFCVLRKDAAILKTPASLSFEAAAAMSFGGTTALDFFRRGNLQRGETVLINGASGAVGSAAVQLAKHFGAHVTGVCSTANIDLVKSLGADEVIDYTAEDFTQNGKLYDVIMDTVGNAPFSRCKASLAPKGRLLAVLAGLGATLGSPLVNMRSDKKVVAGPASERVEDLRTLAELAEKGKYKPFIDRTYPLERAAEAHAYVDTGRKKGNVVLVVVAEDEQ